MHLAVRSQLLIAAALSLQAACFSGSTLAPDGGSEAGPGDASNTADTGNGLDAGEGGSPARTVTMTREGGVPISPVAFGHNYWDWVDWSHSGVSGLTGTETLANGLRLNVIRAGGNNNDTNSPVPFGADEIDKFVAYCRQVGAEPILQVPLVANDVDGGASSAQTAADMVTYANVTKGYGVKYWEIGNEPDLYQMDLGGGFAVNSAAQYCAAFSSYAAAMKSANAAAADGGVPIQLLGPELSYKYTPGNDWLTPFLDGCKDYVDVVTVHRYPFSAVQTSESGALNDSPAFASTLRSLASIVKAHARPNTPLAITEANISYDYDPTKYTDASAVAAPGTFYAALWTADTMGVALENGLWTLAFWNLGEENSTGSVLGFIVAGQPVPAYYAEQMVSANFAGSELSPVGVPTGFSVHASYDPSQQQTAILVINKTTTPTTLALAVDALTPQSFNFPPTSLTLVQIPDAPGGATHVLRYTSDLAMANMPPQMVQ